MYLLTPIDYFISYFLIIDICKPLIEWSLISSYKDSQPDGVLYLIRSKGCMIPGLQIRLRSNASVSGCISRVIFLNTSFACQDNSRVYYFLKSQVRYWTYEECKLSVFGSALVWETTVVKTNKLESWHVIVTIVILIANIPSSRR